MAKKKGDRVAITIECTEAKEAKVPPSRYSTTKHRKKQTERVELKKYSKYLKKHTIHREVK